MKLGLLIVLVLFVSGCRKCSTKAPSSARTIYVLVGQSRMAGFFNTPMTEPGDNRISMWKNGTWEPAAEPVSPDPASTYTPGVPFAKEMLRNNPSTRIGLINCARGSTTLDEWMPNSCDNSNLPVCGLFESCRATVAASQRADPEAVIGGILYMEGESLAHECAGYWSSFFPRLVGHFQDSYGDIPVVFAQLGDFNDAQSCPTGFLETFRSRQAAIVAHKTSMIVTQDLPTSDGVHLTTDSTITVGRRFAMAIGQAAPIEECSEPWWSKMVRI